MEKIKGLTEFLKIDFSSGVGSGSGSGHGQGNGSGHGAGSGHFFEFTCTSGYADSTGDGAGYSAGFGNSRSDGEGYGYSQGAGNSRGTGYGYGDNVGISVFNHDKVYSIDQVLTIIKSIKGNVAKGFILNSDFTLDKCFLVKDGNMYAHGETLREAMQALDDKKWENLNTDEIIAEFCRKFEKRKSYKGGEFFEWHHRLTGSCLQGRESFVKNHDLSLDDEFTVDEFIKLTEEDYNGKIIKQLKEVWEKKG